MLAQDMLVVLCWWEASGVSEKVLFRVRDDGHARWKQSTQKESKFSFMPPATLFRGTDVAACCDVKWEKPPLSSAGFSKHRSEYIPWQINPILLRKILGRSLFVGNDRNSSDLSNWELLDPSQEGLPVWQKSSEKLTRYICGPVDPTFLPGCK